MEPFDGLANALAQLFPGMTQEAAGWILGLAFVTIMTFFVFLVLSKDSSGNEANIGFLFAGVFVAFVVGVEWWQPWTAIFIAFFIVMAFVGPFSK